MEYFFWRFGDLKKRIALSEKKPPLIMVSCFGKLKSYILPAKKISQQGQFLRKKKLFGQATWSPLRSTPRKIKCYQDFIFFYFWPWTHSGSKRLKSAKNVLTWFKTNQQNYSISVCSELCNLKLIKLLQIYIKIWVSGNHSCSIFLSLFLCLKNNDVAKNVKHT